MQKVSRRFCGRFYETNVLLYLLIFQSGMWNFGKSSNMEQNWAGMSLEFSLHIESNENKTAKCHFSLKKLVLRTQDVTNTNFRCS